MRETKFTVHYKLRHAWFWRRIKNVLGDTTMTHIIRNGSPPVPLSVQRYVFELEDGSRVELPPDTAVRFSPERWRLIKQQMEREAGQPIMATR